MDEWMQVLFKTHLSKTHKQLAQTKEPMKHETETSR